MLMAQTKIQYDEPCDDRYYNEKLVSEAPKPKKSSTVKKDSQSPRYKLQSLVIMLVVIGIFGLIGAKTVHTTVVKGAEIRALERELQALGVEKNLLQVEAEKLSSVARIEKAALAMGMEKPEGTIYIATNLIQPDQAPGVEETQKTAAIPVKVNANSIFDSVFRIFTSFFASTQR